MAQIGSPMLVVHSTYVQLPGKKEYLLERLKDGNIHMCFFSCSGYRPFMHPPPSLGNLLLDITLYVQFHSGVVFFFVIFRVRV